MRVEIELSERSKGEKRATRLVRGSPSCHTQKAAAMALPRSTAVPQLAPSQTASALLLNAQSTARFSTSCPQLDQLLSSPHPSTSPGLARGAVLELMGPPGVGKTRTALGMALSARFGALDEDSDAQVLIVGESGLRQVLAEANLCTSADAEGSLSPNLILETAELFAEHNGRSFLAVLSSGP